MDNLKTEIIAIIQRIEEQLETITTRNQRVEDDKAWETSFTRRLFLSLITYGCAYIVLQLIEVEQAHLIALVPTGGYWLSTLSMEPLKQLWSRFQRFSKCEDKRVDPDA